MPFLFADLDHHNPQLRESLIDWLNWLKTDIGFEGWVSSCCACLSLCCACLADHKLPVCRRAASPVLSVHAPPLHTYAAHPSACPVNFTSLLALQRFDFIRGYAPEYCRE